MAVAAERRAMPAGSVETARLLTELSHAIESDGRLDDATRILEEAAALLLRFPDAPAAVRFEHLEVRGRLHAQRGEFEPAASIFEAARTLSRSTPLPAEARTRAAGDLAFALASLGRYSESLALDSESIEQARIAFGATSVEVARALSPYATALWFDGQTNRALAVYEEAIALRLATQGAEHPDYAWTVANYADSLIVTGQFERAEPLVREVLALRGKTLNDAHPMVAFAMALLGRTLGPLGRLDEAERWLRQSYALRQRNLPAGHWLLASSRSAIGGHLVLARRLAEAEPILLAAEHDLTAALGNDAPQVADARRRIVDLYVAWQRADEAAAWRAKVPATR